MSKCCVTTVCADDTVLYAHAKTKPEAQIKIMFISQYQKNVFMFFSHQPAESQQQCVLINRERLYEYSLQVQSYIQGKH